MGDIFLTKGAYTIRYPLVLQKNEPGSQPHTIYKKQHKIGH